MSFTITHPDKSGATVERRRDKVGRLLARGRRISNELLEFASTSRERIAAIDREFPEDTG